MTRNEDSSTDDSEGELSPEILKSYKVKLFLYAILGYVVIFGVLIVLLGLTGGLIALAVFSTPLLFLLIKKKIIFLIIPAIWILVRALWVKFEAPEGMSLAKEDYPTLYKKINSISKKLDTPKVHNVILTSELNAAVVQTPRLGVFGWYKNTIILGLELLLVLSPEQAEAVLAHEMGHLSGNHSKFNAWIYRVRTSWYRIMQAFDEADGLGAGLMARFFDWYAPKFANYSFALARQNEYEADKLSAKLTNRETAGHALVNVHVAGPYVDEHYWRVFFSKADKYPEPKHMPWKGLNNFLATHNPATKELSEKLQESLKVQTSEDDTHPSLSDRLKALAINAELPNPDGISAAKVWLDDQYENVIAEFDHKWILENQLRWRERYDYSVESKTKLQSLRERELSEINDDDLWEKAQLEEEFGNEMVALTNFRVFQNKHPDNPAVAFHIGRILFEQKDEEILTQMKIALGARNLVPEACRYAYYFLVDQGRDEDAAWWEDRMSQHVELENKAYAERRNLTKKDTLIPFAGDGEMLRYIAECCAENGKVKKAWVAQKSLDYFPESPVIVLVIQEKGMTFSRDSVPEKLAEVINLDCDFFVLSNKGDFKKLAKKAIKVGECILD